MEQQGLAPKDLVPLLGSRSRVSEVLSGRRGLPQDDSRSGNWLAHPGRLAAGRRGKSISGLVIGSFSTATSMMCELLEWHAGVEPISYARSRRTVQVAQHDHRLARLRIHAKNRVHSRSAAAVAVGPRLVRPPELESEAVGAGRELRPRG